MTGRYIKQILMKKIQDYVEESVSHEFEMILAWSNNYKKTIATPLTAYELGSLVHLYGPLVRPNKLKLLTEYRVIFNKLVGSFDVDEAKKFVDNFAIPIDVVFNMVKDWKVNDSIPVIFHIRLLSQKYCLIHHAASIDDVDMMGWLLARGLRINEVDAVGKTALHIAARGGHEKSVRFLLSNGASQSIRDEFEQSAFEVAVETHLLRNICKLLNPRQHCTQRVPDDGEWTNFLFQMVYEQKVDQVRYLLHYTEISEMRNRRETVLHAAAAVGNVPMIHIMLEIMDFDPDFINAVDYAGRTALARAVLGHNMEAAQKLLCVGALITKTTVDMAKKAKNTDFLDLIGML